MVAIIEAIANRVRPIELPWDMLAVFTFNVKSKGIPPFCKVCINGQPAHVSDRILTSQCIVSPRNPTYKYFVVLLEMKDGDWFHQVISFIHPDSPPAPDVKSIEAHIWGRWSEGYLQEISMEEYKTRKRHEGWPD